METTAIPLPEALAASNATRAASPRPALAAPFSGTFEAALAEANETLRTAEQSAQQLAEGEVDVVETMIALGRADLSLRFVVALRNRALEAYNEIMRLQV